LERTAIITLTTDFGLNDHFIGAMKGVILGIAPEAQIIDISHAVQPFDILDGALTISQAYSYFPSGTVHMVIVDPGVGTARRPVILTGDRHLFVAPDNGVHYFLQPRSNTFHARDIFSPVAANLAKGVAADRFGEVITDYVRFGAPRPKPVDERTLRGVVLKVDRFGNLITNITPQDAPQLFEATPPAFKIAIGNKAQATRMCTNYADGGPGEVFGILGSMGFLEVAANRGSAFQLLGAGKGSEVNVVMEGR
jgi:S-adenosylmethionine hydrolase